MPVLCPIFSKSFGKDAAFPGTACPNERWMSVSRPQGGRMKRHLIALVLVGACGPSEEQANQSGAEAQPGDAVADAVRPAGLTGERKSTRLNSSHERDTRMPDYA